MRFYIIFVLLKVSLSIPEFSVRLRGGATPFDGRVEVLVNEEWGSILDSHWDIYDAIVTCRQLGFSTAKNFTMGSQYDSSHPTAAVHLQNVVCTGMERSLSECSYENVSGQQQQQHVSNAGVVCAAGHSLRLSGGSIPSAGRLQVYSSASDVWSDACYDSSGSWSIQDSLVVCRQLGYDRVVNTTGVPTVSIDLVSITSRCSGEEFNLQSCGNYTASGPTSCPSAQILTIQCEGSPSTPKRPRVVRSDCQSISISWSAPRSNGGHSVSSYMLRYRPVQAVGSNVPISWQVVQLSSTEVQTTLTGLSPGRTYLLGVSASNIVGTSPFSESIVASTNQPDLSPPEDLTVLESDSESVTLGWTVPTSCGIQVSRYELTYYSLTAPGREYTDQALSFTVISSIVNHTVFLLTPYTAYNLQVRAYGYVEMPASTDAMQSLSTNGLTHPFISIYSNNITFQTREAAPSAAPTSFSAFLKSSVYFSWGRVPNGFTNGIITSYIISCQHRSRVDRVVLSNLTFQHNTSVDGEVLYNCSIAAATQQGTGPQSAPILFFTPPNLNRLPTAPRNVVFDVIEEHMSNSRQEIIVQAQWNIQSCSDNNFSCIEVLGYVASCEDEEEGTEVRKLVWQYEVEDSTRGVASTNLSVRPYTRYQCLVEALNRYGRRSTSSYNSLFTPQLPPALSPMEISVTNLQPQEVTFYWNYAEDPPAGELSGFIIRVYYQDPNNPDLVDTEREPYLHSVRIIPGNPKTRFSQRLNEFVLAATDYIVEISAITGGGEGPKARAKFTTPRKAIAVAPSNLEYAITSFNLPYLFRFTWTLDQPNSISRSMVHSGFTLACDIGDVGPSEVLFSPGQTILRRSVFTSTIQESYSVEVYLPTNCESTVQDYSCYVVAFNELGVGPRSGNISANLPCNFKSNPLANSVLTDPYFSVSLLGLLILIVLGSIISCVALSLFCRRRKRNITDVEKLYATVGEMYDESYIRMAPSDSSIKRNWSFTRNHSNHSRAVPPVPSNRTSTALDGRISVDGANMENPYDEIPGGKAGRKQKNNNYAEVRRPSRECGARSMAASRQDSHSVRAPPLTPRPSSQTTSNIPSQRTSSVLDEFPPPGSRMNARRESSAVTEEGHIEEASGCGDTLHSSPSNTTNLSGNDYVEVTANGQLRLLKRRESSSNSLDKQCGLKQGTSNESGPVLEKTEHRYDSLAPKDKSSSPVHHYDNIPGAKEESTEGVNAHKEEARPEKANGNGDTKDFLEFFDNIDKKKGSMSSLSSGNDMAYVAMRYKHGSNKDVSEDSQ